jgi:hypothetical protein
LALVIIERTVCWWMKKLQAGEILLYLFCQPHRKKRLRWGARGDVLCETW